METLCVVQTMKSLGHIAPIKLELNVKKQQTFILGSLHGNIPEL